MQKNTEIIELTYSNCNSVFRRCQPDKICEFENIPENETLWSQISGVFLHWPGKPGKTGKKHGK